MTHQKKEERNEGRIMERRRFAWRRHLGGSMLLILTLCLVASARNPNDQICFPNLAWYSLVNNNVPPVIDGNIAGDPGWNGAFRYVFGNGTTTPDVIVQGTRDATNSNIYISIQANNLMDWDQYTFVTLAFDPGGTQQALVIRPIQAGVTAGGSFAPAQVQYYHGPYPFTSQAPPWSPPVLIMTGFQGGSNYQWYMEAKLPIDKTGVNGVNIPTSGKFGFYVSVVRIVNELPISPPGSGPGAESDWPTDAPLLGCAGVSGISCQPAATLPPPSSWGNGTIDPTLGCQGVSVGSQIGNIYTNHGTAPYGGVNEPVISLNNPNIFSAYVQNTMVDTSGNPVTAQKISATFKIANFGIPSYASWAIPGSEPGGSLIAGDPTPAQDIPASTCAGAANNFNPACTISTGQWTLNAQEVINYTANAHQCVQVTIDSTPGSNTIILNNTALQNMNLATASTMQRAVEINAKGYPLPPNMTEQAFDLGLMTKSESVDSGSSDAAKTKEGTTTQLTWEAHGCRHTNTFVIVLERKIELCQNVGGFGYVVRHQGTAPLSSWSHKLEGAGVKKLSDNVYRISVPKDGAATLTTAIEAVERPNPIVNCCGKAKSPVTPFASFFGLLVIGLVTHRRSKRNS